MGTIREGAKQTVRNCLKIKPNEKVVIITDIATFETALVIEEETIKVTGKNNVCTFIMEDFGKRPLSFPKEIENALKASEVSLYVAGSPFAEERRIFRNPMLSIVKEKGLRHAHMIGITPEIMKGGMCVNYTKVQKVCQIVFNKVKDAKTIKVTSQNGTCLTAIFDRNLRWNKDDGNIKPGEWMNLPGGEVFTCPAHIYGTIVVDGCLGDYFDEKYGSIEETPVIIRILVDNKITQISCKDYPELERDLKSYFDRMGKNSTRVGEFAIGCNIGIKELIGNMLQDEKFPGIHIAFGNPLSEFTNANWDSKAHLDAITQDPTIVVDDEILMQNGKFLLDY